MPGVRPQQARARGRPCCCAGHEHVARPCRHAEQACVEGRPCRHAGRACGQASHATTPGERARGQVSCAAAPGERARTGQPPLLRACGDGATEQEERRDREKRTKFFQSDLAALSYNLNFYFSESHMATFRRKGGGDLVELV